MPRISQLLKAAREALLAPPTTSATTTTKTKAATIATKKSSSAAAASPTAATRSAAEAAGQQARETALAEGASAFTAAIAEGVAEEVARSPAAAGLDLDMGAPEEPPPPADDESSSEAGTSLGFDSSDGDAEELELVEPGELREMAAAMGASAALLEDPAVREVLELEAEIERRNEERRGAPEILRDEPPRRHRHSQKTPPRPEDLLAPSPAAAAAAVVADIAREEPQPPSTRKRPAAAAAVSAAAAPVLGRGAAAAEEEGPLRKKPAAARHTQPGHFCSGMDGVACVFARDSSALGSPAYLRTGEKLCVFCSPERMAAAMENQFEQRRVTQALRAFEEGGRQDLLDAAFARIPEQHRDFFKKSLARPSRSKAAVETRKLARETANSWETLLEHRVVVAAPPELEEGARQQHARRVADDRRRVSSKFAAVLQAREEGDETWRSAVAKGFETWCLENSWVMCSACHRLEKRPCHEADVQGTRRCHTVKKCKFCKDGVGYPTVQASDIPPQLRGMSRDVIWALRPLEPWTGPAVWAKHGYRVHTDMIRFWWRSKTPAEQIKTLEEAEDREKATVAYEFLMASQHSSCRRFVETQQAFLRKSGRELTGEADDQRLRLPRRCLEEVGLECAVWPHL